MEDISSVTWLRLSSWMEEELGPAPVMSFTGNNVGVVPPGLWRQAALTVETFMKVTVVWG